MQSGASDMVVRISCSASIVQSGASDMVVRISCLALIVQSGASGIITVNDSGVSRMYLHRSHMRHLHGNMYSNVASTSTTTII